MNASIPQNEILDICLKIIQNKIVENANKSGALTIIAEKTLNVSDTEQLSLSVHFEWTKQSLYPYLIQALVFQFSMCTAKHLFYAMERIKN